VIHRIGSVTILILLTFAWFSCERKVVRFEHLEHLNVACGGPGQPQCQSCATCHGKVVNAAHAPPPWIKTCEECHDDGVSLMNRSMRFARAQSERFDKIIFPHDKHLSLSPIHGQCVVCHAGVVDQASDRESVSGRSPPMSKCLECHQRDFERANCTPCHLRAELPRLLPQTFLRHDAAWSERHGISAARNSSICHACHTQTWCADCHEQRRGLLVERRKPDSVERQFKHVGDFLVRHAIEARSKPSTCLRCHDSVSCDTCHIARGVSAASVGAASQHPMSWISRDTGSPQFHGRAARRDPLTCMACHDHGPATNCINCHRVGGTGGNPHPHGWHSSRSTQSSMCRYCHAN
jgi:hypothetical protein